MYGRRFWSRDQHEVEKTMPILSQGMVTPAGRKRLLRSAAQLPTQRCVQRWRCQGDLPGTAPRCLRMDPELLGRTARFQPCLRSTSPHAYSQDLPAWTLGASGATHFEKGSDFPVGKPLPCVLVSTFPQCTATWKSLCSTILQYSCCEKAEMQLTHKGSVPQRLMRTLAR